MNSRTILNMFSIKIWTNFLSFYFFWNFFPLSLSLSLSVPRSSLFSMFGTCVYESVLCSFNYCKWKNILITRKITHVRYTKVKTMFSSIRRWLRTRISLIAVRANPYWLWWDSVRDKNRAQPKSTIECMPCLNFKVSNCEPQLARI